MGKKATAEVSEATIHGIDADKLDPKAIDAALETADIHPAGGADLPTKVKLLIEHFKTVPEGDLADCDNCGAASDYHLPCCPFCGVGGEGNGEAEEATESESADERESAPEVPQAEDVAEEAAAEIEAEAAAEPAPAAPEPPRTALAVVEGGASKRSKLAKTKPTRAAAVAEVVDAKADAPELDREVAEIREIQRGTAAGAYVLAEKLTSLAKTQLWKQRRSSNGQVAYKNFEQFAKAELDMSRAYVNELLKIRARFKEAEFTELGTTKLRLVLQAPENAQGKILEKLKGGASRREVESEVRGERAKAGLKNARGEKAKPAAAKQTGKLTVAVVEGKQKIRFVHKPEKRGQDVKDCKPAKRIGDAPWSVIELANDVRIFIELGTDAEGQIIGKVDIRRQAD